MGFASGFATGSRVAGEAIDAYNAADQTRRIDEVRNARPQEMQGYTGLDGAQMEALANARDANGNPYYTLEDNGAGGLQLRNNFGYQDGAGQDVAAGSVTGLPTRRVVDFLGQRYGADELTPGRMDSLRQLAIADIVGRNDPVSGLRMRREVGAEDRAATEFGWKQEDRPVQQQMEGYRLNAARRTDEQGGRDDAYREGYAQHMADWNAMTDEQRAKLVREHSYNVNVKGFGTWTPGSGKSSGYMTYLPETGKPIQLSDREAAEVYALTKLMSVDPLRARQEMDKVSNNVRDFALKVFDSETKGATASNHGQYYADMAAIHRGQLAHQREASNKPTIVTLYDKDNAPVLLDARHMRFNSDGVAQLPAGLKLPKQPQELNDREKIALTQAVKFLSEAPPETDAAGVYRRFGLDPNRFGIHDPVTDLADAIKARNASKGAAGSAPAPAPAPAPRPRITTIVPPRSAADLQPRSEMSDYDLAAQAMGLRLPSR